LKKYEVVFIVKLGEEEEINAAIAKFENLIKNTGGTIDKIDRWGRRRLAYAIKDMTEGYYCLIYFTAAKETVFELDRVMKITDELLKHMIVTAEK
jgi:small subunit ribosomal protein S6